MDTLFEVDDQEDVLRGWFGGRGQRPPRAQDHLRRSGVACGSRSMGGCRRRGFRIRCRRGRGSGRWPSRWSPGTARSPRSSSTSVVAGGGRGNGGRGRRRCWRPRRIRTEVRCGRGGGVRAGVHRSTVPAGGRALARHGVRVWLPEADGPVDPADPTHRALVTALGASRAAGGVAGRHRTLAAMRAQTREQGRSWVGVRRTGIGWSTLGRTRTGAGGVGSSGCSGWILIR